MMEEVDDSCASIFQLLGSPKKKKKSEKLNRVMNEQSTNPSLHPSFSIEPSSVFPLHIDNQRTEDNLTQQQESRRGEKDTRNDLCAGNFQFLGSPKKKKKRVKLEKLNGESVNPFFIPSFSSDPSFVFPLHVDNQETEDNQTQEQKSRRGEKDTRDDLCAGSFQFMCSPKKKKKKVKLKLNGEKSEPLVNPFSNLSFFAHPSSVFPLHVDSQDTEDNQTQQQKSRREGKDTRNDLCAGSFQLLSAPKKKRKKKNKLEKKLNGETNEQSVNSFFNPSFFSAPSSVFPFHVDSQETEDNQTEQQKSRREEKDTGDDSCAGSFQLLSAPKKKRKKKNTLEKKLNGETNEHSVNYFFNPSFSSAPSSVYPFHVDSQETKDNQTEQQKPRRKEKDTGDDSCAGSFQLLSAPKKKRKKKNKLNGETNEQSVNPFFNPSFSSDPFVIPLHVDNQETEDNQTQQQESRRGGKDTHDDLCAGSFQLLSAPKKKRKKKNKLEKKLNGETNEQSVNSFFNPSFSSVPSSVFPLHVDNQEIEDNQTQQQKSRRGGKGTKETPESQMENSWVVTESNLDDEVGTVTINEKRKRKHMSSEQDGGNEFYIPETPKDTSSLPEADHLEKVGGSCEISTKKNEEEEVTKVLEEQVEANEASVGRPDFASDLVETQEYIFVSPSQTPLKTQDAVFLQNKMGRKLSIPDPSARLSSPTAQKKLCKHKKLHHVSSPTGNSDATKDGLLVKDTMEADGKHDKSHQYQFRLQHSCLSGHRDERGSSSKYLISEPDILDNEFLESPVFPMRDLETVTQELEEFIPHVRTLSDPSIKQLSIRDLVRFKHFKKQGISVRFGRFSKKENELLRKNMEAFLEETGISSAEKLLFTERFPEELAYLKRLKCEHLFGLKIAQGIPRPWRLVYYRARKMFDPRNYNGKYSEKEKKMLMKYQAKYGNNWKKMSKLMDRSSHSLHLKYCEMKSKFNSGAWSREETKKLLNTLKEILSAKVEGLNSTLEPKKMDQAMLLREHLYKDIPWFWVEAKVGTRGWKQCKKKWLYIVTKKMSGGKMWNRGIANVIFKINVIERLYQVENVDDINWEDISHIIGNVPPDYVRNRFYKMKSMYVPSQYRKTFSETIGYLHKEILPMLRSKVEGMTKRVATRNRTWKSVFQFNYIFQDENDLIDDEEEEEEGLVEGVTTE